MPALPRIAVLSTSYPRRSDDDAGVFVARLVSALSKEGATGTVLVPYDQNEPKSEIQGNFKIERYRYGVFSKGRLAFGSGILPNLRKDPTLIFQAPALIIQGARAAAKASKESDVMHCNWIVSALSGFLAKLITKKPYVVTARGGISSF